MYLPYILTEQKEETKKKKVWAIPHGQVVDATFEFLIPMLFQCTIPTPYVIFFNPFADSTKKIEEKKY